MQPQDVTIYALPAIAVASAPSPSLQLTEESVEYNWRVVALLAAATLASTGVGYFLDGSLGVFLALGFAVAKFALGGRARTRMKVIRKIT